MPPPCGSSYTTLPYDVFEIGHSARRALECFRTTASMAPNLLIKGLLIGLSIAAPVGPIGLLCIRRSLEQGRIAGLATGLGAATADTAFGAIAGFGLTAVSGFLLAHVTSLRLVGGAALCYLGVRTFLSAPARKAAQAGTDGLL